MKVTAKPLQVESARGVLREEVTVTAIVEPSG